MARTELSGTRFYQSIVDNRLMDTLMPAQRTLLLSLLFIALALLSGCEENPITEGLLKASPPDDNRTNDRNNGIDEDDAAEALGFNGFYQGNTGQATIADTDDALTMAVSSYRLWHLQRVQQSLDNLVRNLIIANTENREVDPAQVWNIAFGGVNCGDDDTVTISNSGDNGHVDFDGFCVERASRTDNFPFTLTGRMEWRDGRAEDTDTFDNPRPARRTVSFNDLQVQWRGSSYSLTGRNILADGDEGRVFLGGLDARLIGSDREWRILTQQQLGSNPFSQQLMVDSLGAMAMSTSGDWVTPATACPESRGAVGGQSQLSSDDSGNPAFFQMALANCNQFNLLGTSEQPARDSNDRDLDNGPFNLADRL